MDLGGLGQLVELDLTGLGQLLLDDLVAEIDALVADVDAGAGDQFLDLLLALPAERALQQVTAVTDACHECRPQSPPALAPSSVPGRRALVTVPAEHVSRGASQRSDWATCRRAVDAGARTARPGACRTAVRPSRVRRPDSFRLWMISSTMPYSLASSAVRILSRSMSSRTCSGRAAAVLGQRGLQQPAHPRDLVGLDLQVGHLTVDALGGRLVDQDAGVLHREPAARGAGRQQHRRGRGGLAEADRLDVRPDELHRVVDGHQRGERATRRVDVHADVAVRVGRLQAQQLRHHVVGRRVVDLHAEEDDALLEQLVVRVGLLDPVAGALDEGRQHVPGLRRAGGSAHLGAPRSRSR